MRSGRTLFSPSLGAQTVDSSFALKKVIEETGVDTDWDIIRRFPSLLLQNLPAIPCLQSGSDLFSLSMGVKRTHAALVVPQITKTQGGIILSHRCEEETIKLL